jgi:hypothetical protein
LVTAPIAATISRAFTASFLLFFAMSRFLCRFI